MYDTGQNTTLKGNSGHCTRPEKEMPIHEYKVLYTKIYRVIQGYGRKYRAGTGNG